MKYIFFYSEHMYNERFGVHVNEKYTKQQYIQKISINQLYVYNTGIYDTSKLTKPLALVPGMWTDKTKKHPLIG